MDMANDKNNRKPSNPQGSSGPIVIDESAPVERVYSNYVELRTSPLDVTLSLCEIDPPAKVRDQLEKGLPLEISAKLKSKIVLPFEVFLSLAHLLHQRAEEIKLEKGGE